MTRRLITGRNDDDEGVALQPRPPENLSLDSLPYDVAEDIFTYLRIEDVVRMSAVSASISESSSPVAEAKQY